MPSIGRSLEEEEEEEDFCLQSSRFDLYCDRFGYDTV
jgi:hypothetical protein